MRANWEIWIDTGGTFTDCLGLDPAGHLHRQKILSSSVLRGVILERTGPARFRVQLSWPSDKDVFKGYTFRKVASPKETLVLDTNPATSEIVLSSNLSGLRAGDTFEITTGEEVPVLAARILTRTPLGQPLPPLMMKLGSTRGTNAILERKGARTALLVTKGFKDLLVIGTQQRNDLFTVSIKKDLPLYDVVMEVDEHVDAQGKPLHHPDMKELRTVAAQLRKRGVESVAIAFLNSYRNPEHELMVKHHLMDSGFSYVSASHQLSSQIKILQRAETTVANAYLDPIIHRYLDGIKAGLSAANLQIMTSAGSLLPSGSFHPKDSLLSGPAGGVVGAARQATLSGLEHIIAFDMGGTSTDVSLYNGRFDYRFESRVANFKILSPSLAIETIAAGGGSICGFDGHRFFVGPHSAGARPGPACYGAGGPLTITDVNLLLGRIDPAEFAIPVYPDKSAQALNALLNDMKKRTGKKMSAQGVLESLVQIANEKMAEAIRKISIQQGYDPAEFALLSFGGAGGQHACALAEILSMKQVLVPYDAGLLSAYGIGHASMERFQEQLVMQKWTDFQLKYEGVCRELFEKAKKQFVGEGVSADRVKLTKCFAFLRFKGQESSIEVDAAKAEDVVERFRQKYEDIFGHWLTRDIEIESVRVIASVEATHQDDLPVPGKPYQPEVVRSLSILSEGRKTKCKVYRWETLRTGAHIKAPALIVSNNSTTYVAPGWEARLDERNNARLVKKATSVRRVSHSRQAALELFTNRFTAIAQEMGALLQRTSFSVNVKERLDFSCALLDAKGSLIVNAPHIPVHLGSMGVCVRAVKRAIAMNEGDVVITNHPAYGGSHLPDVTLIKPVFHRKKLIGYVANRAHHAEIGGRQPGSMPSDAKSLEEEGVIIPPMYLVQKGKAAWGEIKKLLTIARYPTRSVDENLADLNGALASVNMGEKALTELCEKYGVGEVVRYMNELRLHADRLLSERMKSLKGFKKATEKLDDGTPLSVKISARQGMMTVDFTGSGAVHPGNLNATYAIVQSVVLYCLRLWVDRPLPMNEGLMKHVRLILPEGLLNPDFKKTLPAVVGGNTEVSQRLTDTVIKALDLAACSQGTMNNFLFGNNQFGFYETICGGTGASPGFDGAEAVHQHMTNTRITDAELMELRYPVRVIRFELRKGSGGKGKWKGGDGVIREVEFLEPLLVNLLTQHRVESPYGKKGGEPGKTGEQYLVRANGKKEKLKGMDTVEVGPGDHLVIMTPGGGGWGVVRGEK
ncbi:MAG: hydantoinase B/oxoprolinase family protein [Bacteroidetes bacterium]|nr:hydantoinase B/oxoprolinase family protein [Bacteroidota bacterium]